MKNRSSDCRPSQQTPPPRPSPTPYRIPCLVRSGQYRKRLSTQFLHTWRPSHRRRHLYSNTRMRLHCHKRPGYWQNPLLRTAGLQQNLQNQPTKFRTNLQNPSLQHQGQARTLPGPHKCNLPPVILLPPCHGLPQYGKLHSPKTVRHFFSSPSPSAARFPSRKIYHRRSDA